MTEAMPFLQKAILLSYAPRPFRRGRFFAAYTKKQPEQLPDCTNLCLDKMEISW